MVKDYTFALFNFWTLPLADIVAFFNVRAWAYVRSLCINVFADSSKSLKYSGHKTGTCYCDLHSECGQRLAGRGGEWDVT